MKVIQKYQANDGTEFTTKSKCLEYEALCAEVEEVMRVLPKRPDDTRFSNGHGYVQHTPEEFWFAREELLKLGNLLMPHRWFEESIADRTIHPSWCGRLFDEVSRPLARAWYRFMCTDKELREWGQPYFAENPER